MKWLILFSVMSHLFVQPSLTPDDLKKIKEPGTYPVEVSTTDQEGHVIKETVMITITNPSTVIFGQEAIDAQDISIAYEQFLQMTHELWVVKSHAKAWNIESGQVVDITSTSIQKVPGTSFYELILKTQNGATKSVRVYVENKKNQDKIVPPNAIIPIKPSTIPQNDLDYADDVNNEVSSTNTVKSPEGLVGDYSAFDGIIKPPIDGDEVFKNVGITVAFLAFFPVGVLVVLFFVYRQRQKKVRRWLVSGKQEGTS